MRNAVVECRSGAARHAHPVRVAVERWLVSSLLGIGSKRERWESGEWAIDNHGRTETPLSTRRVVHEGDWRQRFGYVPCETSGSRPWRVIVAAALSGRTGLTPSYQSPQSTPRPLDPSAQLAEQNCRPAGAKKESNWTS